MVAIADPFDDPLNPVFSPRKALAAPLVKTHKPAEWFDIRVFYVRVSSSSLEYAPDALTMHYSPKSSNAPLEVNGVRIAQNVHPFLTLKRDRMDKDSGEVTYVSTDNLRTCDDLSFKVFDKDDQLIHGTLKRVPDALNLDSSLKDSKVDKSQEIGRQDGWTMECSCVIASSKCSFTRKRPMFSALSCPPPCVEVYMAGRVSGSPVVLTETVKLIARRKYQRHEAMDTIAEDETIESPPTDSLTKGFEGFRVLLFSGAPDSSMDCNCQSGYEENNIFAENDESCKCHDYAYVEGDEGELSWFKAGVRVGVGIGLGICLGVGLGVGVLVRSYQSTTRTLNSRAFRKKIL